MSGMAVLRQAAPLVAALLLAALGHTSATADCAAVLPDGVAVEYPSFDVTPGIDLASGPGVSPRDCLKKCLKLEGCQSAVFVNNFTRTTFCYYKSAPVSERVELGPNQKRFVAVGCESMRPLPDRCAAFGKTTGRYPFHYIRDRVNVGESINITAEPAEDECLRACLEVVDGCNSAVLAIYKSGNEPGQVKTCFFSANTLDDRVPGFNGVTDGAEEEFVVLGCENFVPPADPCLVAGREFIARPGLDFDPGNNLGSMRIREEPAGLACLRACLNDTDGCKAAVLVTSATDDTIKTCYFKFLDTRATAIDGPAVRAVPAPERFSVLECQFLLPSICDGVVCPSTRCAPQQCVASDDDRPNECRFRNPPGVPENSESSVECTLDSGEEGRCTFMRVCAPTPTPQEKCDVFGATFTRYPGFDVPGAETMPSQVVSDEDECASICLNSNVPQPGSCRSAVFDTSSGECFFKQTESSRRVAGDTNLVTLGCRSSFEDFEPAA